MMITHETLVLQALTKVASAETFARILLEAQAMATDQGQTFQSHDGRNMLAALNHLRVLHGHLSSTDVVGFSHDRA